MEHEYKRDERAAGGRFILNQSASSARIIRDDEITPAERRAKEAELAGMDHQYVEMFCERYRDRGMASRMQAAASKQEKEEALERATAPGTHVRTEKLAGKNRIDAYRSGMCDGKRYMTVDDFDRYYHDQRGYRNPQYRTAPVATDEERIAAVNAVVSARTSREKGLEKPKKAGWLTDTDKLPSPIRKLMRYRVFRQLNEWAGETFPRETEIRTDTEKRFRPIPVGVLAALVTVVVSMSMVISSTVLVSQSTREVSELKENIAELKEVENELSDQLDLKSDMLDIKDKAIHELGMVPEKYLNGEYLTDEKEDHLEVHDEDSDGKQSGWSAILSAFGHLFGIGKD